MKTLTCDVCGKKIDNPISARNYFHVTQFDICEDCHDKLEGVVKPQVRAKQPFSYDWYENLYLNSVSTAVQKGKY
jgi:ribosome-binding protein aMBF1 (putative translation factor)